MSNIVIDLTAPLPKHVAIIMDGNRRWARQHGLEIILGHQHVVDKLIEPLTDRCIELGISHLTLWAFSTENWDRDKEELDGLMRVFRKAFERKTEDLHAKGVRMQILGDINRFPKDIADQAKRWASISQDNTKITVSFALNYGGREEILRGIKNAYEKLGDKIKEITADQFSQHLDTAEMPDPDLIIRPGGQQRLSGFMPWQTVYAELYFSDLLMPDFSVEALNEALADFQQRQRRFGK